MKGLILKGLRVSPESQQRRALHSSNIIMPMAPYCFVVIVRDTGKFTVLNPVRLLQYKLVYRVWETETLLSRSGY